MQCPAQQLQVGSVAPQQRHAVWAERGELQHHRQVVGQLGVGWLEPGGAVGRLVRQHRHAPPAGVAVPVGDYLQLVGEAGRLDDLKAPALDDDRYIVDNLDAGFATSETLADTWSRSEATPA